MLKVGFGRLDITLPLGTGLAGYFQPRPAKGVLDPLSLNAIAFSDGAQTALLITVDALGIREMFCDEIRALIAEKTGVAADHIIINALHQHTSFVMRPKGGTCALQDEAYISVLYRKFADVAKMAVDDMVEATLYFGVAPALEPLSFIRRYRMKDGSVKTNPGKSAVDIVEPAGMADNNVRLLRFVREGKGDVALVNFCTHPDVIGHSRISADWPGFVRRFVEEEHRGTSCILVNGFEGDVNHINFQLPKEQRGSGYAHSEKMGRVIADTVNAMWDAGKAVEQTAVRAGQSAIYNKTRTDGAEDYEICKPIYEAFQQTGVIPEGAPITDLAYLRRVVELRTDPIWRRVPVSAIAVGELAFVGLGGEPFSHYAQAIREQATDKTVLSVCCANGFEGYLPTTEAFAEGGYEATASAFTSTLEEQCVSAAVALLSEL